MPREIVLIAHNLRSTHNVGSLLRTADGLGVNCVYLTGYTPYPNMPGDKRLPHIAQRLGKQIHKTALGAETSVKWQYQEDIMVTLNYLKTHKFVIASLEQTKTSISLLAYDAPERLAIIVGREVGGIEPEVLNASDITLEIPMLGDKESHNVTVAAAIALYHCRYK